MRIIATLILMAGGSSLFAQQQPRTGPAVGSTIPAFEAPDQNGRLQSLRTISGPKGAMLVFFRSADWWPYCKGQLVELEHNLESLRKQGLGVVAISYDSVAVLKNFAARRHITLPMLSDPGSKIIRTFGLLNDTVPQNTPAYGIPFPGTYIVNPQGVVTAKYFEDDYRERDTSSEILIRQYGVNPGHVQSSVQTKHLTLSASASGSTIGPGQHLILTLEVELKPKMHVYAPGVQGYIPIDWSMKGAPLFTAEAATYPASKILLLPAINERVPVYEGKFRLIREVVLTAQTAAQAPVAPGGELTVEGAFRYQACDDRICYIPQTIPLKWSFRFEAADRIRVPEAIQKK
jgi:peroxiredoxin